jgi:hypothetical protein
VVLLTVSLVLPGRQAETYNPTAISNWLHIGLVRHLPSSRPAGQGWDHISTYPRLNITIAIIVLHIFPPPASEYLTPIAPSIGLLYPSVHPNSSQTLVTTVQIPSALTMADEASGQHHKRQSADQSISPSCHEVRTTKRQERDRSWRPKSAEVDATLVEAINTRKRQKRNQGRSPKSAESIKDSVSSGGHAN